MPFRERLRDTLGVDGAPLLTRIPLMLILLATLPLLVTAYPHRRGDAVDTTSLQGKWLYGYQGWFRRPGPGANTHWSDNSNEPGPNNTVFDFFPYVSEYPSECLFSTGYQFANGTNATLYDTTCEGVVDTQFRWMQEYGIDGVIVQRFYASLDDSSDLEVLGLVRSAAEKYGRGFMVEYDISGSNSSQENVANLFNNDYNNNVKSFTSSSAYIKQDGKPALMAFGVGIREEVSTNDTLNLVRELQASGTFFGLGVAQDWRDNVVNSSGYAETYTSADFISPWTIGAYLINEYPDYYKDMQEPDFAVASQYGLNYAPVIWPGTSAGHLNGELDPPDFNYFPRDNGSFYQLQAQTLTQNKPFFFFNAMFDEVNEGTGMEAVLRWDELPVNERFVGIADELDNNHYLALGGQLASAYRGTLS